MGRPKTPHSGPWPHDAPIITGYFARTHNCGGSFALAAVVLAVGIAGYALGLGKMRVIAEP